MLTLTYAFSVMDRQVLAILLEDIRAEFVLNDTQLGLLSGLAFALFYSTLGIPIARLADRVSRINIISTAVALWSIMTALCGAAQNFIHLFLGRIGVGIGEAGSSPPSHSMLSDLFSPSERSLALAIVSMGSAFGSLFGLVLGGYVSEAYGWRMAFIAAGVPGVVLAIVLKASIREPARGALESTAEPAEHVSFGQTLQTLWQQPVYRWITIGHILAVFSAYNIFAWLPALYIRKFEMAPTDVGVLTGFLFLGAGAPGYLIGGWLGGRLARRDPRWLAWLPATTIGLAFPAYIAALATPSIPLATALFGLGLFMYQANTGPSLALVQNYIAPHMRAQAVAVLFFCTNMIGLGLGPILVGYLSDLTTAQYGNQSLAIALGIVMLGLVGGSAGTFYAARKIGKPPS
jgi:MFS family permease